MFGPAEQDLMQLFASGFTFNFERFDITLPSGVVSAKMLFEFGEEDPATFDWTTLLLSTAASISLSIPDAIVQMLVQTEPNMAMAIGGGYLVKRGDAYELEAQLRKGLLTVNGAPIPLPLGAIP
jgi:predicted benzoate:H+ symporter BenE